MYHPNILFCYLILLPRNLFRKLLNRFGLGAVCKEKSPGRSPHRKNICDYARVYGDSATHRKGLLHPLPSPWSMCPDTWIILLVILIITIECKQSSIKWSLSGVQVHRCYGEELGFNSDDEGYGRDFPEEAVALAPDNTSEVMIIITCSYFEQRGVATESRTDGAFYSPDTKWPISGSTCIALVYSGTRKRSFLLDRKAF